MMESSVSPYADARKKKIAESFSLSSGNYDNRAAVQLQIAKKLARALEGVSLPPSPRILEIGCGTGFLSVELLRLNPGGRFIFTDLSSKMTKKCRDNLAQTLTLKDQKVNFSVMDGERLALKGEFDLAAASLAFQWFDDVADSLKSIANCLSNSGVLLFATLGSDTFNEWRTVHDELNFPCGLLNFPSAKELKDSIPENMTGNIFEERLVASRPNGLAFLQDLKAIGATFPSQGYTPLSTGNLRKALKLYDSKSAGTVNATYHALFGIFKRKG